MSNKTLPKTQYEISKGLPKTEFGKANDISLKDDAVKELNIGLFDLDYAIKYYFDEVIKPTVKSGDTISPVPVVYGSPEKWKNFQEDGYFRDTNGKMQSPLIAYKRTTVTKNRTLSSKVDANFPAVYYTQQYAYTPENKYDQFSKLTNAKPLKTFSNTVMCDYVDLTYEFIVWTDYVEQMNKIVEAILYSEGSFWGEKERFKFRTKIDSFTNTTDLIQDNERLVRTTFTVTLFGYIVPDAVIKQLSDKLSSKTFSPRQITLDVDADTRFTIGAGTTANIVSVTNPVSGGGGGGGGGSVDTATLTYLNTNKAITATSITSPNLVYFSADFLTAPTGLPTTSASKFTFFINGLYVEPAAVTSFINSPAGTCTLVLDVAELGYTVSTQDEIIGIGKFQ